VSDPRYVAFLPYPCNLPSSVPASSGSERRSEAADFPTL
jgi:hypothetical protein